MKRVPMNYKAKKTAHIVYYDIENVHEQGFDCIKKMKVHEFNIAFYEGYQKMVNKLVNNAGFTAQIIHHIPFDECEKDKADVFLLNALKRDLARYSSVPNLTFVIYTKDKGLQNAFKTLAIQSSAYFRVMEPPAVKKAA